MADFLSILYDASPHFFSPFSHVALCASCCYMVIFYFMFFSLCYVFLFSKLYIVEICVTEIHCLSGFFLL